MADLNRESTSMPGLFNALPAGFDQSVPPTMSSREIADLVESRHDSVKRAMERLMDRGLIRFTPTVETSHDGAGARPILSRAARPAKLKPLALLPLDRLKRPRRAAAPAAKHVHGRCSDSLQHARLALPRMPALLGRSHYLGTLPTNGALIGGSSSSRMTGSPAAGTSTIDERRFTSCDLPSRHDD